MQLKIEELGHLGDGIAHAPNGDTVFVPNALPDEVVACDVTGSRAIEVKIIEPSPHRVKPPCRHAKSCGGCLVQHGSDALVAQWKQGIVETALKAQGLEAPFREMHVSPTHSRRRAVFSGRRTKKGAQIGFHAKGDDQIIDLSECVILNPALLALKPLMAELVMLGGSRKGEMKFSVTASDNGADVDVQGGKPAQGNVLMQLAVLAEQYNLARLSWGAEVVAARLPAQHRFGKADVVPPPGAFLQATPQAQAKMVEDVLEAIGPAKRVVDLFAGCGTFTLPVAAKADVWALETEAAMLQALDAGWRKAIGLHGVKVEARDLFRRPVEPIELKKFDAVVIDPPRAGAEAQCTALAASTIKRIAFVSCTPVTFARDAKILCDAGFKIEWIRVLDQFRWSSHVEVTACLTR